MDEEGSTDREELQTSKLGRTRTGPSCPLGQGVRPTKHCIGRTGGKSAELGQQAPGQEAGLCLDGFRCLVCTHGGHGRALEPESRTASPGDITFRFSRTQHAEGQGFAWVSAPQ